MTTIAAAGSMLYLIPTFVGGVLRRGSGSLGLKNPLEFDEKVVVLLVKGAACSRLIKGWGLMSSVLSGAMQPLAATNWATPRNARMLLIVATLSPPVRACKVLAKAICNCPTSIADVAMTHRPLMTGIWRDVTQSRYIRLYVRIHAVHECCIR